MVVCLTKEGPRKEEIWRLINQTLDIYVTLHYSVYLTFAEEFVGTAPSFH